MKYKNTKFLFIKIVLISCFNGLVFKANSQEIRTIDNKGTVSLIRNNQVYSSTTAPVFPLEGDIWVQTPSNISYAYNGTAWLELDVDLVTRNNSAPTNPQVGDIWYNSTNSPDVVNIWNGTSWLVVPNTSPWLAKNDNLPAETTDTDIYKNNKIGVGDFSASTIDADLHVKSTSVPIRIEPSTSTPTGSEDGQMFVGDDGLLYIYDATRGKWLSTTRQTFGYGVNSANVTNAFLREYNGTVSTSQSGCTILRNATITGITVSTRDNETWVFEIRKKGSGTTVFASLSMTSEDKKIDATINVDLSAGDVIQGYCNGSGVSYPQTLIEIAWRK